jgi:spermidine synthase
MDLRSPDRLVLPYTRAMMAALLFCPEPANALMLGLGGGSLARFMIRHWPELRLLALEREPAAVALARHYFRLPAPGGRVEIRLADASGLPAAGRGRFDVLLVDLFDDGGLPDFALGPSLYRDAHSMLAPGGVMAVNLWLEDDDEFLSVMGGIREIFEGSTLVLTVENFLNLIVLAFPDPPSPAKLRLPALYERARALRTRTRLEFPELVDTLRATNLVKDNTLVP